MLRVSGLSSAEHDALAQLTGAPARETKSMQVDLARLDAALRDAGIAASLHDALEQLDGAIVHRATALARAQRNGTPYRRLAGTKRSRDSSQRPHRSACSSDSRDRTPT